MALRIQASAATDSVKKTNQDSFVYKVARSSPYATLLAVADGVGSLASGNEASAMAIAMVNDWWQREAVGCEKASELEESLRVHLQHVNTSMYEEAQKRGIEWGTTLTLLAIVNGEYLVANTGDSRAYRVAKKLAGLAGVGITQLSEDHTVLVQKTENRFKAMLTQCLGIRAKIEPSFSVGKVKAGHYYLVSSDGVTKRLQERDIVRVLVDSENPKDACRTLIQQARDLGERDDITAALAQIHGEDKP